MIANGRRRGVPVRIMIAAAAAVVPVLAGCEAGFSAATQRWHQPTDGTFATVGDITISNAFILGAPIGQSLPPGHAAGLFLALINTGPTPDRLLAISAQGTASSVTLPGGTVGLPTNQPRLFTGPKPEVLLMSLTRPLRGGSAVQIKLVFARAGLKTLMVPVMPWAQFYTTLSPAPATPSPGAAPSVPGHHARRGHVRRRRP